MVRKQSRWSHGCFRSIDLLILHNILALTCHLKSFASTEAKTIDHYGYSEGIRNNTEMIKVINYSLLTKVVFSNNNVVVFVSIFSLMTCPFSLLYTTSVSATTKI